MANVLVAFARERYRALLELHHPSQCFIAAGRQQVVDVFDGAGWPVEAQQRADARCPCPCWDCRRGKHEPEAVGMGLKS